MGKCPENFKSLLETIEILNGQIIYLTSYLIRLKEDNKAEQIIVLEKKIKKLNNLTRDLKIDIENFLNNDLEEADF